MRKELQTLALGHESVQVHRAHRRLMVTHPDTHPGTPAPVLAQFKSSIILGGYCKIFENFPFSLSWSHSFCYFSQGILPWAPDSQKKSATVLRAHPHSRPCGCPVILSSHLQMRTLSCWDSPRSWAELAAAPRTLLCLPQNWVIFLTHGLDLLCA